MVESKLRFFEVEIESMACHALELGQAVLRKTPEGLDSVDVVAAISELVFTVTDPEVFCISDIDQTVVANPAVSVYDGAEANSSTDKPLQRSLFGVRDDMSPDAITALQDAKHDRLFTRAPAPLSFDPVGTEVRFVDFNRPSEWCFGFTDDRQATAYLQIDVVHRSHADAGKAGSRAGRQILPEATENLAKLGLADFRRSGVLVNSFHNRSIAHSNWCFAS